MVVFCVESLLSVWIYVVQRLVINLDILLEFWSKNIEIVEGMNCVNLGINREGEWL